MHAYTQKSAPGEINEWVTNDSPRMSAPSSDAGCYGSRWHYHARSSSDRAGNLGNAGSDSGSQSYRCRGSRNRRWDDRLTGWPWKTQNLTVTIYEGKTADLLLIKRSSTDRLNRVEKLVLLSKCWRFGFLWHVFEANFLLHEWRQIYSIKLKNFWNQRILEVKTIFKVTMYKYTTNK